VTATNDQQPVKALGTDGAHPTLRICVGVGCLPGCQQHFGALRAEYVVEPTAELPVTVADEEAHRPALLAEHHEQVAGLLGDPGAVGVGGHPG